MSLRRHGVHSELAWRRGQQMEQMRVSEQGGEELLGSPTCCSPSVQSSASKEKVGSGKIGAFLEVDGNQVTEW